MYKNRMKYLQKLSLHVGNTITFPSKNKDLITKFRLCNYTFYSLILLHSYFVMVLYICKYRYNRNLCKLMTMHTK